MRFYSSSTHDEADPTDTHKNKPQNATLTQAPGTPCEPQPVYFYYFNNYCNQFLYLSNQLSQELVLNNNLISLRASSSSEEASKREQLKMDLEIKTTESNKNTSQYQELPNQAISIQKNEKPLHPHKPKPRRKKQPTSDEEDSYKPEEEDSRDMNPSHVSQSKNIPKNYGKAVLNFIYRNDDYVRSVLNHLNMDQAGFMDNLLQLRGNVNTIVQLRALWLEEENPYAKVYRIVTMQYLRRHSLSYIFNSRVQNFHKHIKYRYKMVESVSDPRNFTHMKEF